MADGARIVALLPAHDEERTLPAALASLREQTRPPDHVVDNCTDGTADVATAHGVPTLATVANTDRKAGALNQALDRTLPASPTTTCCSSWTPTPPSSPPSWPRHSPGSTRIPVTGRWVACSPGDPVLGLVGALRRNEYTRYARARWPSAAPAPPS